MGLDEFKSENDTDANSESQDNNEAVFGMTASAWNGMSKSERVKHVRNNYIEGYHPSYKPDGGWEYVDVAKVRCVCDAIFIVDPLATCSDCGRVYKKTRRAVIKK
jgi:hypothetical protein